MRNLKTDLQFSLNELKHELHDIDRVVEKLALRISPEQFKQAKSELEQALKAEMKWVLLSDKNYPVLLRQCDDPPLILYYRGDISLLNKSLSRVLSIVGTRKMTAYGSYLVRSCIQEWASLRPVIVSGLAYGVDYCAQELAVRTDLKTVQVCAHGLDLVYPQKHRTLFKAIERDGLVLSEYPPGTAPLKHHFLRRNRIIAGVSWATLVVESALKGGSLTTAQYAFDYNRPLFCFPGRTTDTYSQGCNLLIRQQKAIGVLSAFDIARELNWPLEKTEASSKQKLHPLELRIMELAQRQLKISTQELMEKLKCSKEELTLALVRLEHKAYLKRTNGYWYEKV